MPSCAKTSLTFLQKLVIFLPSGDEAAIFNVFETVVKTRGADSGHNNPAIHMKAQNIHEHLHY